MITILAIEYLEPSYEQTKKCIEATGLPVIYVRRNPIGVGSLSEAINRGMKEVKTKFAWIVTNITFEKSVPEKLLNHIQDAFVIHPSFKSDHGFMNHGKGQRQVPFVEFTAPLVRVSDWGELDESMPYWGMDIDYGLRMFVEGKKILVDFETKIDHVYIRNSDRHPITLKRLRLRRMKDAETNRILIKKWGENWREKAAFKTTDVGAIYKSILKSFCKYLIIDCDGVLTNGKVIYGENGERFKEFHSRDITAIKRLVRAGFKIEIRTQSSWKGLNYFAERCGATVITEKEKTIPDIQYLFIGDDYPDIELMRSAIMSYCPADANEIVKVYCTKLKTKGGEGVISELVELLLESSHTI
jgi:3-deoxy-D-manno-octulosonate 8-phosphate phosphatase (KDO 8-P phosphatase)